MALTFNIVAPSGSRLHEEGLESIVVRRREAKYFPGSEVVIMVRHGPLLMQTQPCVVRLTRNGLSQEVSVGAGIVEVYRDHVTLVET